MQLLVRTLGWDLYKWIKGAEQQPVAITLCLLIMEAIWPAASHSPPSWLPYGCAVTLDCEPDQTLFSCGLLLLGYLSQQQGR